MHRTTGALATKSRPVANGQSMTRTPNLAGAVQGSLFTPNVIPISVRVIPPAKTLPPGGSRPGPRAKASASTSGTRPPVRRAPKVSEDQGELEFLSPVPAKPRTLNTSVDAVIYCEAPVATPMHRALAGAVDGSLILIGYGMFLATFFFCGGGFELTRTNLLTFGAALMVIAATYGLFWTIAGAETAGMRWMHLQLITFDGFRPDLKQRLMRFAATWLSFVTLVGVLWALADEESLGWQDHMSRTFPTAHELESRLFRRR